MRIGVLLHFIFRMREDVRRIPTAGYESHELLAACRIGMSGENGALFIDKFRFSISDPRISFLSRLCGDRESRQRLRGSISLSH